MKKESATSQFVLPATSLINEALKAITANRRGAVIIVDDKNKVVGIASDGDIRRALLRGSNTFTPISKAMNPHCLFIRKDSAEDKNPDRFFKAHPKITIVPVVTANFVLSHIYKLPDGPQS
jgi:CBS domain-containing protein